MDNDRSCDRCAVGWVPGWKGWVHHVHDGRMVEAWCPGCVTAEEFTAAAVDTATSEWHQCPGWVESAELTDEGTPLHRVPCERYVTTDKACMDKGEDP